MDVEAADASFELLLREHADGVRPAYFDVESWRVITEHSEAASAGALSEATVKLVAGGQRVVATGEGNGPGQRPGPGSAAGPLDRLPRAPPDAAHRLPRAHPRRRARHRRRHAGAHRDQRRPVVLGDGGRRRQHRRGLVAGAGRRGRVRPPAPGVARR